MYCCGENTGRLYVEKYVFKKPETTTEMMQYEASIYLLERTNKIMFHNYYLEARTES